MAQEVSYIIRARNAYSAIHRGADKAVDRTAQNLKRASGVMVIATGAVSASLFVMMKTTAASGDEFQKMSARLGLSSEALSELKFAAELSGASIGDIELGIKKMSKTALDAERGLISAKRSFDELGISVTDSNGNLKNSEKLFTEVSEGLKNVENETKRTALAQELLGRSGLNLLPLIKSGADGLKEMRQEAQDLGITFTDFEANQSAAFVDASLRIQSSAIGIKNTLSKELIPFFTIAMDTIAESFIEVKKSGDLDKWAADMAEGVITAFSATAEVATNMPMIWHASMVSVKTIAADGVAIIDTVLLGVEKFYGVMALLPGTIGQPYQMAAADISEMRGSLSDIGTDLLISADASSTAGEEWAVWQLKAMSAIDGVRTHISETEIVTATRPEEEIIAASESTTMIVVENDKKMAQSAQWRANITGRANSAMQQSILGLVETGKFSVGAFANIMAQQAKIELTGIAAKAGVQAIYYTGRGLAATAMGDPRASGWFAAAGQMALITGAATAAASAVHAVAGGSAGKPAPGTAGGEPIGTQEAGALIGLSDIEEARPVQHITLNIKALDPSEINWDNYSEHIVDTINRAGAERDVKITMEAVATNGMG